MRRGPALVVAVLALALAGCAATPSGAGTPVATASAAGGSGAASPASSALVAQAALAPCPASTAGAPAASSARTLPDLTLPCLGTGPAVSLAALAGRPTVVNVWAAWCVPCRAELPVLGGWAASHPSVRVLGVDAVDDPSSALSLLAQAGAHYPSVRDDAGATKASLQWGAGLPVTLLVRPDGTVAYQQHGALTSAAELDDLVRQHLGSGS